MEQRKKAVSIKRMWYLVWHTVSDIDVYKGSKRQEMNESVYDSKDHRLSKKDAYDKRNNRDGTN